MVKKNSIPDRWRNLTPVGQRVPGSRFIAFKVPLKGVTNQRVTQTQKFTPKDLITAIRTQKEELGLIIDLTNTERYYTTKDLPKSVQYVKLHTAGLKIPDDATIHQFKRVAWKFLAANSDNDKLIGVHCTTGINRTGYLICRYLIDVDAWRPLTALSAFSQSRGHPIEGTVYIEDIVKGAPRSNVGIDLPPTIDEPREVDDRPDDMYRGQEGTIKSLLELIPGNEHVDFDARAARPLPLMRARSDEYQDRPGGRLALVDSNDDCDLRSTMERREFPSNMPEHPNAPERFRRPADFNSDGRLNSGPGARREFHGSEPRPLMALRDNFGPRGMQHEQMGYDEPVNTFNEYDEPSYLGSSGKMNSAEYDDMEAERRIRSSNDDFDFRGMAHHQERMENESLGVDPRAREMINSLKGLITERMHTKSTRTLEGLMNVRKTQLVSEPMNEMMSQRQGMEGPIHDRMHPKEARYMEGSVNERFPQRDTQGIRSLMGERMHPQNARPMTGPMNERMQSRDAQFTEGPMSNRMYPRGAQQMEASTNEKMPPRVARLMDLNLNNRLNPREEQAMGNSTNDRIPQRDSRPLNRPMNEMMTPRIARSMEEAMPTKMHPRMGRAMEGTGSDQTYSREGLMNDRMYPRNARNMQGSTNEQMYTRDPQVMEGSMDEGMYQEESEYPAYQEESEYPAYQEESEYPAYQEESEYPAYQEDSEYPEYQEDSEYPAYQEDSEYPAYQQDSEYPSNPRRLKMTASANVLPGTNRFTPYPPSVLKPTQPAARGRGLPRSGGPRAILAQAPTRFPLRNQFN